MSRLLLLHSGTFIIPCTSYEGQNRFDSSGGRGQDLQQKYH